MNFVGLRADVNKVKHKCEILPYQPQPMTLSHFRRVGKIEVNHKGKAIHKKISVLGLKQ